MHNAHDAFLSWHLKVKTAMLLYYDPPTITSFRSFVNTLVLMALDNNLYRLFIVFILSFNRFADFQPLGAFLSPYHTYLKGLAGLLLRDTVADHLKLGDGRIPEKVQLPVLAAGRLGGRPLDADVGGHSAVRLLPRGRHFRAVAVVRGLGEQLVLSKRNFFNTENKKIYIKALNYLRTSNVDGKEPLD